MLANSDINVTQGPRGICIDLRVWGQTSPRQLNNAISHAKKTTKVRRRGDEGEVQWPGLVKPIQSIEGGLLLGLSSSNLQYTGIEGRCYCLHTYLL